MANPKIKFHRVSSLPSATADLQGHVYFRTTDNTLHLCNGNGGFSQFSSNLSDASFTGDTLTITKRSGGAVTVNLKDVASAEKLAALFTATGIDATNGLSWSNDVSTELSGDTSLRAGIETLDEKITSNYNTLAGQISSLGSTYKVKQSKVSSPTLNSGNAVSFISDISQNEQGVISATKKTIPTASDSTAGITKVGAEDGAAAFTHTHSYAGSSSSGGAATSANKLNTNAGSSTQPVYFSNGVPVAITGAIANNTTGSAAKLSTGSTGSPAVPVYFNNGVPTAITSYSGKAATSGTADKVGHSITVGTKSFNGSADVTVNASDLGLESAMRFIGVVSSLPSATTSDSYQNGDVILVGNKEYVRSGKTSSAAGSWVELGDEGSFTLKSTAYNSSNAGVKLGGTSVSPTITVTGGSIVSGNTSVVTGGTVYSAISGITDTLTGTPAANSTITSFDQVGGKVSATFSPIVITKSQISDFPESITPTSHTHGNITNGGAITAAAITPAASTTASSADYIILSDASSSGKLAKGIQLTGTAGNYLTASGTWAGVSITATATDDDVVVLTGTNGTNGVTFDAKHATQGPSTTADTVKGPSDGLTVSGSGASGSIVIPKVTVNKYGHVTALSEQTLSIKMPTLPSVSNSAVTLSYSDATTDSFTLNGSAKTITMADAWMDW